MNGASIIKCAWYRLNIKFAGDPEFQDAAVLRIAAREASKLAADAAAAAAVVLAAAVVVEGVAVEGVALNGENGNAALVGWYRSVFDFYRCFGFPLPRNGKKGPHGGNSIPQKFQEKVEGQTTGQSAIISC